MFDLETVLNEFAKPRKMLVLYKKDVADNGGIHRHLFRKERKTVSNTIMDWVILKGILLRRGDFLKVFEKIREIFPKETAGLYYKPPRKKEFIMETSKSTESSSEENDEESSGKKCDAQHKMTTEKTSKKKVKNIGPSGLLYSSYRYRLEKKRDELKEYGLKSSAYYR